MDSMLEDQELKKETRVPDSIDEGHAVDICMHFILPGLSTSETCMLQLLSRENFHIRLLHQL
jgi:hypothetical protein